METVGFQNIYPKFSDPSLLEFKKNVINTTSYRLSIDWL